MIRVTKEISYLERNRRFKKPMNSELNLAWPHLDPKSECELFWPAVTVLFFTFVPTDPKLQNPSSRCR